MEATPIVDKGFEAYKEYGFAGLFVFVFLLILLYLLYALRRNEKENMALAMKAIASIERSNIVGESQIKLQVELKDSLSKLTSQQAEVLAYLEGRDSSSGLRRRRAGDG